jgi:hypothetical protein
MKNLNVKHVTQKELEQKWSVKLPVSFYLRELFIRCNKKGEVNWEVAPVYTKEELEKRGDYTTLILLDINEFIESPLKPTEFVKMLEENLDILKPKEIK